MHAFFILQPRLKTIKAIYAAYRLKRSDGRFVKEIFIISTESIMKIRI